MRRWSVALAGVLGACSGGDEGAPPTAPTFTRDVAPILYARCADCHRPEGSGPFALLDYGDVRDRAGQIAEVTSSGFMPPWLPTASDHAFAGDRSLTAEQIETLRRWAEGGAVEGDPGDLPERPTWSSDWVLGEPDLVLQAPAFELAADGTDEFVNFVLPNPEPGLRFVAAVEIRPGSRAAHHAILQVDRTRSCRKLDAEDPDTGFRGMVMGESEPPDGHFVGWTPGRVPRRTGDDMAWRLAPRTDLVLQVHLTRLGKRESVAPRIGLHFTDQPPRRFPFAVELYDETIDIPAGSTNHRVTDRTVLPVDVVARSIYPHAHYLGRSFRAAAELPGGEVVELLRIADWSFDWQDEYVWADPVPLPAGSVVTMEWTYDNSADNVRNPNRPPERVRFGPRSVDEMGTMSLQVLPDRPEERVLLEKGRWEQTLRKRPWDWHAHNELAVLHIEEGRFDAAIIELSEALELYPDYAHAESNLGLALQSKGLLQDAVRHYRRALELEPDHGGALTNLGIALAALGRRAEAVEHLRSALELRPDLAEAHLELGNLIALGGDPASAIPHFRQALRIHPGMPEGHNNLANALLALGEARRAIEEYERALQARPAYAKAHAGLAMGLLQESRADEAVTHLEKALEIQPGDAQMERLLEMAREAAR